MPATIFVSFANPVFRRQSYWSSKCTSWYHKTSRCSRQYGHYKHKVKQKYPYFATVCLHPSSGWSPSLDLLPWKTNKFPSISKNVSTGLHLGFYKAWTAARDGSVCCSPGVNAFVKAPTPRVSAISAMSLCPVWEVLKEETQDSFIHLSLDSDPKLQTASGTVNPMDVLLDSC